MLCSLYTDDLNIMEPCDREIFLLQSAKLRIQDTTNVSSRSVGKRSEKRTLETPTITVSCIDDEGECHEHVPVMYEDDETTGSTCSSDDEQEELEDLNSTDDDHEEKEQQQQQQQQQQHNHHKKLQQQSTGDVKNKRNARTMRDTKLNTNVTKSSPGEELSATIDERG